MTPRQSTWNAFRNRLGRRGGMILAIILAFLAGAGLYAFLTPAPEGTAGGEQQQTYTCPMHPQVRSEEPDRCPICGMDLVPVEATGGVEYWREYSIGEEAAALMDFRTSATERRFVTKDVRMVGKVDYDETRVKYITAWVPGRLDRLFVDYTGVRVQEGDHMVEMYSPELLSAQEELIQSARAMENLSSGASDFVRRTTQNTLSAARDKLRLLGLTAEQIRRIEQSGEVSERLTIYAPLSGIVIDKNATQGMYVETGTRIYTIADLSTMWVQLDAYESDLPWLRYGQPVEFTTVSYPGEIFRGRIVFIDPILDPRTRTVKVRVNVPNPDGRLKPDMFVKAIAHSKIAAGGKVMQPMIEGEWICPMHPSVIAQEPGDCTICGMDLVRAETLGYTAVGTESARPPLVIPATAPLITGKRAIVYVEVPEAPEPTYHGREIVLGPRAGEYYLVRHGLREGERVVTHGGFKIDSALQIMARPSMMTPDIAPSRPAETAPLPESFRRQLSEVQQALQKIEELIDGGAEPDTLRDAFAQLGEALEAVEPAGLGTYAQAAWGEYAMRLRNDVVIGRDASTIDEFRHVAQTARQHLSMLRRRLEIEKADTVPKPPAVSVSAEERQAFSPLLDRYLAVQRALAEDDLDAARQAAAEAKELLADTSAEPLAEEQARALREILGELTAAEDFASARQAFRAYSRVMIGAVRELGPPADRKLFRLHCPMAFDGEGADWLQDTRPVNNPYYGESMLTCGSVEEVFLPPSESPRNMDHGEHRHGE